MNIFAEVTLINNPSQWIKTHGLNILVILAGAWVLRRVGVALLTGILNRAIRSHPFATETDRKKRVDTLDNLLQIISKILVWTIATIMIVDELGINTAPLLASAGVVGIALGIGAQSLIKDFTNGLFIIIENQYRVGDTVQFGTISGVVQAITIRTTVLKDLDGNIHHIPNSTITVTTNKTFGSSGIRIEFEVALDTDLTKLEKLVNDTGLELAKDESAAKRIKRTPYFAQVVGIGDRGIKVKILGETTPGSQWNIRTKYMKLLQPALLDQGIDIALAPRSAKPEKHSGRSSK